MSVSKTIPNIAFFDSKSSILVDLLIEKLNMDLVGAEIIKLKSFVEILKHLEKNENVLFVVDVFDKDYFSLDVINSLSMTYNSLTILIFTSLEKKSFVDENVEFGNSIFYLNKNCHYDKVKLVFKKILKKNRILPIVKPVNKLNFQTNEINDLKIQNKKLSNRETQILNLLFNGFSQEEIGLMLNLSSSTISTYKMRILKKTNTNNLVELTKKLLI